MRREILCESLIADGIFSKLDAVLASGDTSQLTGVLLPALNQVCMQQLRGCCARMFHPAQLFVLEIQDTTGTVQAVYGVEKNNSTERSIPASGAFFEVDLHIHSDPTHPIMYQVWVLRSFLTFYHRSVKSSCVSRCSCYCTVIQVVLIQAELVLLVSE